MYNIKIVLILGRNRNPNFEVQNSQNDFQCTLSNVESEYFDWSIKISQDQPIE